MKELFGGCLMLVGILVAGASGICSLMMFVGSGVQMGDALSMLPMVAMIGGIPLLGGIGIAVLGRSLIRDARHERQLDE